MESFDNWEQRFGKKQDFWVINCAEKFLELSKTGDNKEIFFFDQIRHFGEEQINRIAG